MKPVIQFFAMFLLAFYTVTAQSGLLKKISSKIQNATGQVTEAIEPVYQNAGNGVSNNGAQVADWLSDAGNKLAKYNNVIQEAWETGWHHSGSLEYTGPAAPAADSGSFTVLTYNIDGFPQAIGGNSSNDTKTISTILESMALDVVVFQEDFTKHDELLSALTTNTYPYRTDHWRGTTTTFGDGLTTISNFPFNFWDYKRIQWEKCGGTLWEQIIGSVSHPDCMTEKGFSVVTLDIDADLQIDLYNLHQDAGGDNASLAAKQANMAQLAEYINSYSAGRVVIVAGDFNMELGDITSAIELTHLSTWLDFLNHTGLSVMCMQVLKNWNECDAAGFDKPDHILFKGNNKYTLTALAVEHAVEFGEISKIDTENGLSDHYPLKGTFYWERK